MASRVRGGDALQHGVDHLPRRRDRQRHVGLDHDRAGPLGDVANHVAAGVVVVRGHEDFVAGPKIERPHHAIDARRGVLHEHHVGRIGPDQAGERIARLVHQRRHLPHEEIDRLALHFQPKLAVAVRARPAGRPRTSRG